MSRNFDKFCENRKISNAESLSRMLYIMMSAKHIGQPYSEVMNMPIPVMLGIIDEYKKDLDREAKAMKKKGKQ